MTRPSAAGAIPQRTGPARRPVGPRRVSGPARRPAPPPVTPPLRRLVDHPLLDRLIRGRTWIGIIAFALIGIVAMQVALLKLNAAIGRSVQRAAVLQRENSLLTGQVSAMRADGLRQAGPAHQGMIYAPPGDVRYLTAGRGDAGQAAASMVAPRSLVSASTSQTAAGAGGPGGPGGTSTQTAATSTAAGAAPPTSLSPVSASSQSASGSGGASAASGTPPTGGVSAGGGAVPVDAGAPPAPSTAPTAGVAGGALAGAAG